MVTLHSMTRVRKDGRREVADHRNADTLYGCLADSECILMDGHVGDHSEDREQDSGPNAFYVEEVAS